MDIYCSEARERNDTLLFGTECYCLSNVAAHAGKLLWYNGIDVVSYDPFHNDQTIFIGEFGSRGMSWF